MQAVRRAYKALFSGEGTLQARVETVALEFAGVAPVEILVAFLRAGGDRGVTIPRGDEAA